MTAPLPLSFGEGAGGETKNDIHMNHVHNNIILFNFTQKEKKR